MTTNLNPELLTPLHGVRNARLFNELREDMAENGWQGRPLLVIQSGSQYLAWTGSHRIAAAITAKLEAVPCYVVPARKLAAKGYDPLLGHVEDWERLKIMQKVGDETAIHLMWSEGRC